MLVIDSVPYIRTYKYYTMPYIDRERERAKQLGREREREREKCQTLCVKITAASIDFLMANGNK